MPPEKTEQADTAAFTKARRASWARLIKRVFEVDPLLCSCGAAMYVVSVITDPDTIDHILEHLRRNGPGLFEPCEPSTARAPPA